MTRHLATLRAYKSNNMYCCLQGLRNEGSFFYPKDTLSSEADYILSIETQSERISTPTTI